MTEKKKIISFRRLIWDFYKKNKRNFPWRETTDPYKILVSEIMLQQTQAPRVVAFYQKWIKRFPNFSALAKANFSQIYPFWNGLGYNRRAMALQKLAKAVIDTHKGKLPLELANLEALPGIGPYTARAVSIFSFNTPVACIETNIRRVFIHHFFPKKKLVTDAEILKIAELVLPTKKSRDWHWALMDYGAHLKSQIPNPNRRHKNYSVQSKFEGSLRQIRGRVLRSLVAGPKSFQKLDAPKTVLETLEKEGLIKKQNKVYSLN